MIQTKCIQKFRNKQNRIIGYRLQDNNGQTKDVNPEELKRVISNGQITVVNLKLTSNGRLIDTEPSKQTTQKSKYTTDKDVETILMKSKIMGLQLKEIHTVCNHTCYILSKSDDNHIILIPSNVTKLNESYRNLTSDLTFTKHIQCLQGRIKVIGGLGLTDAICMFKGCKATSLDLSSFNTSNVTDMESMFEGCKATHIDFSNFDTSNVTDMSFMFCEYQATSLDLSSFNTSNVKYMCAMFKGCKATSLDLSSFNTSKVTTMESMFKGCKATSIDLSNFDTSNVTDMESMFEGCKTTSLDLSNFDTSNVKNMDLIFERCEVASIKTSDPRIQDKYNNR